MRLNVLLLCLLASLSMRAAEGLPAASDVVQRVLERAQLVARGERTNHYAYEKRSITHQLDEKDRITQTTEKLYEVKLINGLPFQRLVKVQGRTLSAAELAKEDERENAFRQRVTRVDLKRKAKRREALATPDLVNRFDFAVTRRESMEGRQVLVLTFVPKAGLPEKSIEDKVYSRVFGTAWIDEEEHEIARIDAQVRGPVPLGWFGAVGSLQKFQIVAQRARMPDGVWVGRQSHFSIAARKLFSPLRFTTIEESTGFRRE